MRLDVDAQPQPQSRRGRPQQCSHPYISMVLLILGIFCCFLFVVRCLWRTIVGVFLDLFVFLFCFCRTIVGSCFFVLHFVLYSGAGIHFHGIVDA